MGISERISILLKMEAERPEDPFLKFALALEYIRIGDNEAALQLFTLLSTRYSDYLATYLHYGQILERMDQTEKAVAVYRAGIAVASKSGDRKAESELKEALINAEDA